MCRSCSTRYSNLSLCRSVHLLLLVPSFLTIASNLHQHASIRTLPTPSCSSLVVPRGPRRSHVVLGRTDHVFLSFLLHRRIVRFSFQRDPMSIRFIEGPAVVASRKEPRPTPSGGTTSEHVTGGTWNDAKRQESVREPSGRHERCAWDLLGRYLAGSHDELGGGVLLLCQRNTQRWKRQLHGRNGRMHRRRHLPRTGTQHLHGWISTVESLR